MWVLLSVLMIGVPTQSTSLANLKGKWTVGLSSPHILGFGGYSILWRPWKTVMVGIDGYVCSREQEGENDEEREERSRYGRIGIGFYKYFRAQSSFSPFIALSPYFRMHEWYYKHKYEYDEEIRKYMSKDSSQTYGASLDLGLEYFFTLVGRQLSLRFAASLADFSRTYGERTYGDEEETHSYSYVRDELRFYLPTETSLSTWLCFHF